MQSLIRGVGFAALVSVASAPTWAQIAEETDAAADAQSVEQKADEAAETVVVIGEAQTFAATGTTEAMIDRQSAIGSAVDIISDIPGVLVNQGDAYGFDDWSTTITIRGFSTSLDEQQIGSTIDGMPNGNSNYGGGAKANRYIDTPNIAGAEVSQGTADIASRSHEALGGTIDYRTDDPLGMERMRVLYSSGSFDADKYYVRYDTPTFAGGTSAWVSVSSQSSTDFFEGSAQQMRDHLAAKLQGRYGDWSWTGYASYDDTHEDNYQRVTPGEFADNPHWDRLTGEWGPIPYVNQLYRRGWSTLRENTFGYFKLGRELVSGLNVEAGAYYHDNEGRGDWVPPYIVDVTNDGEGNPESELMNPSSPATGPFLGRIYFVDANGVALQHDPNCVSSITFPYGGAGAEYDPACYPRGAIPVQSYRTTNYWKERYGFTADVDYEFQLGDMTNMVRGGLWYEDYRRDESRTWQAVLDARVGADFDHGAYYEQYNNTFPVTTLMLYAEDTLTAGPLAVRLGLKQFYVDLEAEDNQTGDKSGTVNSDSDLLLSGGVVYSTPVDGLEAFAGYAQNYAAIKDTVLEREASAFDRIEAEKAENIDVGLRFDGGRLSGSITFYSITFDNRLVFVGEDTEGGPDYLIGTTGLYLNFGGVESTGVEIAGNYQFNDSVSAYLAYTSNDSKYTGTGDATLDESLGIAVDNTVFGSVEQQLVLATDMRHNGYVGGVSWTWVDERWLDPANTQRLDAYNIVDIYAGVEGSVISDTLDAFDIRLNITNAFDESYIGGVAGGWGGWIGAPRTAVLSLQTDF